MSQISDTNKAWVAGVRAEMGQYPDWNSQIELLMEKLEETDDVEQQFVLRDMISAINGWINPKESARWARRSLRDNRIRNAHHWHAVAYLRLAFSADQQWNYHATRRYLNKAWELVEDDPECVVQQIHILKAKAVNDRAISGRVELEPLLEAIRRGRRSDYPIHLAGSLCAAGEAYYDAGLYDESIDLVAECLEVALPLGLKDLLGQSYWIIGNIANNLGHTEKAEESYRLAMKCQEELGVQKHRPTVLKALGSVYRETGRFEEAREFFSGAVQLYSDQGAWDGAAAAHCEIALSYMAQEMYTQAMSHFQPASELTAKSQNMAIRAFVHQEFASCYAKQEMWDKSAAELEASLSDLDGTNRIDQISSLHEALGNAYQMLGRYAESVECFKKHVELEQQLVSDHVHQKLQSIQLQAPDTDIERMTAEETLTKLKEEAIGQSSQMVKISLRIARMTRLLKRVREQLSGLEERGEEVSDLIGNVVREIDGNQEIGQAWEVFEQGIKTIEPVFIRNLTQECPSLTSAELRTCSLLRIGLSNKEIAELLNISPRTVDTHRNHIRRKLGLPKKASLEEYLAGVPGSGDESES